MPILILSRKRPSLRWERISVSHSIATAASPTAAKEPDKYRCLIGAMSAHVPKGEVNLAYPQLRWRLRNSRILQVASAAASSSYSSPTKYFPAGLDLRVVE